MELRDALTQISVIRRQMARTEVFRGYRAVPVAFSGVLALAAALIQATWILEPAEQMPSYLALWVGAAIVSAIGADPDATMYALRHSSIVRMLKVNVPIRLVASLHNTSTKMIEKHYSKYITEHSDDISRHALLHHEPPVADNVVALAR